MSFANAFLRLVPSHPLPSVRRAVAAAMTSALAAIVLGVSGASAAGAGPRAVPGTVTGSNATGGMAAGKALNKGAPERAPAPVVTQTGLVQMPDGRLLAPEFARIASRGELVVAVLAVDQPPFFQERDGQLSGLDIDLARDLAQKLHVKARFNRDATTFNGVVNLLAKGHADVAISKLSRTLPRTQIISFSTPYLRLNRALLLNRVKLAQLLRGRSLSDVIRAYDSSIGVVGNSSYLAYAQTNFPKAQITQYPTWELALKALNAGEIAAVYRDEFEVKRVLRADPTASLRLRVVTLDDLEDTLGIGVNVSEPALLAFVNQFLAERPKRLEVADVLQAAEQ
jgi:ABC-type amino acid transport substrate-binding protein